MRGRGLYDPAREHDACGMGFVASIGGERSHGIVRQGLEILAHLDHRGGVGADPDMGDGAGCLIQLPDALLRDWAEAARIALPAAGDYAVAMCFLPRDATARAAAEARLEHFVRLEGQVFLGWRDVPVATEGVGAAVLAAMPAIRQALVARGAATADQDAFERKLLAIRKQTQNPLEALARERGMPDLADFYIPSFSSRTIVYKGMLLAHQLGQFYTDLTDARTASALAMVHQRFSTNTFPSWRLAHPFRFLAHNGEINTLRGNVNWMNARRRTLESALIGADLDKMWPIIPHGQSDSACLDNALELLVAGGYSLAHAMMLLVPEAWAGDEAMDPARRAFYEYHAALMEPWDGPAAIAFTDGRQIGATLDRNGLRPARFAVTDDGLVVMASEAGVLPIPEERIVRKWRLQPGRMLLIDLEEGRIVEDEEVKATLAAAEPYAEWLRQTQFNLADLPAAAAPAVASDPGRLRALRQAFGYTDEDLKLFLAPMAETAEDPVGSMGTDTPLAILSDRPRLLYDYFKQGFAQVTNPPIDPIRESLVMSLVSMIGPRPNLLGRQAGTHKRLEVAQPVLTDAALEKVRAIRDTLDGAFRTVTLDATWPRGGSAQSLDAALQRLCWEATEAVLADNNVLILSDRAVGADRIPIPAALATGAVHHHLIRQGLRMQTGLVVETGEAREVHHFAVLAGYGAEAVNPWLAFATIDALHRAGDIGAADAAVRYIGAIGKGLLKVMSKMGISTYQSYCGAQIFDAVGIAAEVVDRCFTGTASPLGGIGLAEIAEETARRHRLAYGSTREPVDDVGGLYAVRAGGEAHGWTAGTIANLQHAVRGLLPDKYAAFAAELNDRPGKPLALRSLLAFAPDGPPVPLDEVEPAAEIVKRFATGAMSFGSIGREAHTTLARAMNRIGGRSNTGEGGEEPDRLRSAARSAIKQVASGRFGVTTAYLAHADEIQIKMAQGAKPGEGGQLPGHKVDAHIAAVRHSTPGVGLISPPPHHDIYSIEDLAQLIHDLRRVNPRARISVKLVAAAGVGTIAAGVAKCGADQVTVSGYEGGTGASPLTSLSHAGLPWEIGLAEAHQTLLLNGLRPRIRLQADGGLRTGRDVAIAALLGAEDYGFATAPLIASGCIMMRKCHLNTCPVGIATQDPVLRAKFTGEPEHVINYFFFVAEELRAILASLGLRSVEEMVGRTDLLRQVDAAGHWKAQGLDLSRLLHRPLPPPLQAPAEPKRAHDAPLDAAMLAAIDAEQQEIVLPIRNVDRSVGTLVSGELVGRERRGRLHARFVGTAGQSFGAFAVEGLTLELVGDANDYVGKGLCGARLIIRPPEGVARQAAANIVVGNTCLYGATGGEAFFAGVAGERFAVRNSGALAVVEGTGDHGCEYMTGGVVAVLGGVGRNFAAGMSGGVAYVHDPDRRFAASCNAASVDVGPIGRDERGFDPAEPLADMLRHDDARLRLLVGRHAALTGSRRAAALLADWPAAVRHFVKVMPHDYRAALEAAPAAVPPVLAAAAV
ncbi:MAG: glutamate synthase large subunit [Alphaproteobacteria bacterium]|nr:glutamate synthase large subunit [Alphaproteobacteria bacterium]